MLALFNSCCQTRFIEFNGVYVHLEYQTIVSSSRPFKIPVSTPSVGAGIKPFDSSLVYTQIHSTPPLSETPLFRRAERFALQSAAASFLPGERVSSCLRKPVGDHVSIKHNVERESFGYRNLETCGSVWMCPVCAAKISEKRRAELVTGISRWKERGGAVALLTFTVRHSKRDSYAKTLGGLSTAFGKLLNRKAGKRTFSMLGVAGRIRSLETTYGENGWHPHFHILLFLKEEVKPGILHLVESSLLEQWQSACISSGLNLPNSHGCTLKDGSYAAKYVSKWGLENEMTKGHTKKSKTGYSPFDLLRVSLGTYEGQAESLLAGSEKSLFKEYAFSMKSKRQLVWSDGLRDLLGLQKEKTDKELVDEVEPQEILFAKIPLAMWKIILKTETRAEVLESCRAGIDSFFRCCQKIFSHYEREKNETNPF